MRSCVSPMPQHDYYNLVELARICSRQASLAQTEDVARTLRRMAREYVQEAAKLDDGKIPDIGLVCLKEVRQRRARAS
jgi:thiaminase